MAILDIILGILLLLGLWKGFNNGLFIELASIIALIAGIYGAIHFSYVAGNYLTERINWEERYITITAFVITFIAIVIAVHFAGKLLTKVANIAMLGLLNKLAGAVFGTLKVAVILGALLIFFDRTNNNLSLVSDEHKNASILYHPVKDIGTVVFDTILQEDVINSTENRQSLNGMENRIKSRSFTFIDLSSKKNQFLAYQHQF